MYSINCLTQWIKNWIKNNWLDKHKKPIKNKDLILSIYNIIYLNPRIHLLHIEAHTNKTDIHSIGNSIADKLARDSIIYPPKGNLPLTKLPRSSHISFDSEKTKVNSCVISFFTGSSTRIIMNLIYVLQSFKETFSGLGCTLIKTM